jgi:hypothetical protein
VHGFFPPANYAVAAAAITTAVLLSMPSAVEWQHGMRMALYAIGTCQQRWQQQQQ